MVADAPPNRRGGFLLRWSPREERRAPTHGSRNGVKWFSDDKAVAFITPDEGTEDLFVHRSGIAG